jgi:hypothetical protein
MALVLTSSADNVRILGAGGLLVLIAACAAVPNEMAHLPMYGGMDRKTVSAFRDADEKLRAGSIEAFGTLKNASEVSVDHGFQFVAHKEYSMAMKRFNQAWVLDPDNPRVYWGFGMVLVQRGQSCDAVPLLEKALSYESTIKGLATHAVQACRACATTNAAVDPVAQASYIERVCKPLELDTRK